VLDVTYDCQIYGLGTCPAQRRHLHALLRSAATRKRRDVRPYHVDSCESSTRRDAQGHEASVVLRSGRQLRDGVDGSVTYLGGSHVRSSRPTIDLGAPEEDMSNFTGRSTVGCYGVLIAAVKLVDREQFRRQFDQANTNTHAAFPDPPILTYVVRRRKVYVTYVSIYRKTSSVAS
jgi:hypothetical protein